MGDPSFGFGDPATEQISGYELLKHQEARPADGKEIIHIVGLTKDSEALSRLEAAGIDSKVLEQNRISREDLLKAGFVFLNRVGGGEKPLINALIPVEEKEGGQQAIDLGARALFTQRELDAVIHYQQQHPEDFSAGSSEIEKVRQDMLAFLEEASAELSNRRGKSVTLFKAAQGYSLESPKYSEDDREALRGFFTRLTADERNRGSVLNFMMEECMVGVDLAIVRGIPVDALLGRRDKLAGAPSPFLDSGFHFSSGPDVTLYPNDKSKTCRLNPMVIHLLSRGLSEMGGSLNNSHDQAYMNLARYVTEIYSRAPGAEDENVSSSYTLDQAVEMVADRLLIRARRYLEQKPAY